VQIALRAAPRKVTQCIVASMNARHNVIDMEWPLIQCIGQPTIFAALSGPLPNKLSRPGVYASVRMASQSSAGLRL
jgi:hypothetical protein